MTWIDETLDELADKAHWGYRDGAEPATEPVAWAALTLEAHGRFEVAARARAWLTSVQAESGSLGISASEAAPHWPTGLAVLAWRQVSRSDKSADRSSYTNNIEKAIAWMLTVEGQTSPKGVDLGHDTWLKGWPWVEGTHSWMEPTAFNLLALKATGHGDHPRAREAVRLLIDRLLPDGGANYGNTSVLGQFLRPHLEPTGLALTALAGEVDESGRLARTIQWAESAVGPETTAASLAFGLIGLAAHGHQPPDRDAWLAAAAERTRRRVGARPRLSLLTLAALGAECPLIVSKPS